MKGNCSYWLPWERCSVSGMQAWESPVFVVLLKVFWASWFSFVMPS